MTIVKGGNELKKSILITLIIAIAAICITMVIVGEATKALAVIGIISAACTLCVVFTRIF